MDRETSEANQNSSENGLRAEKIDLEILDMQLEKFMNRAWPTGVEKIEQNEEDGLDFSKLDIRCFDGSGTYTTVYRGTYDGKDVAVKLLELEPGRFVAAAKKAELRALFKREAEVWHNLDHPNVTKCFGALFEVSNLKLPLMDIGRNGRSSNPSRASFIVLEYLPGGTLRDFLIRNKWKKLAFTTVIQLALDLARGLSYLHSKNIVHRDIKTENLLLDGKRNLKIADFSLARVEAQNPSDMSGQIGTPGYMAPEVLDRKPYNRMCDVYSFGICLWEIYCCDLPHPILSLEDMSTAVVRQKLRPKIPRCCPSALATIMRKCWDAKANKRPEMAEIVRMLEAIETSNERPMIPDRKLSRCFCFNPARGREFCEFE